ncbi:clathrin light chain B isoform X2 [Entelurus aequoreus]|uniref:clathrin light chain B isoform X2 n=1 Tax=Entelurus aequoreus TaxID=161455 RepID=UPI002B1E83DC|nr:clathrin light chain B isoform X2 [Entelurus aequoreus]
MADNGAHPTDEDPAAEFLAQQENEIAGIENDAEGFEELNGDDGQEPPQQPASNYDPFAEEPATVNGDIFQESNGPTDNYAAIAQVDIQRQEPESLRKWREEQKERLEVLDSASKAAEAELREKAKKELEDWHVHQSEQMEKNKANNRSTPTSMWAQLWGNNNPRPQQWNRRRTIANPVERHNGWDGGRRLQQNRVPSRLGLHATGP